MGVMTADAFPVIGLIACSVLEREIVLLSRNTTHIRASEWFDIGLHDQPDRLRTVLQEAIDGMDEQNDLDAIVLAYGLCGCGIAGLRARRHPIVIPRAHDCITLFMGSKERYAEHQQTSPFCYYYTPGWNRNRRVPGPEKLECLRQELSERFDPEDVEFLIETEQEHWSRYDTAVFLDLGTADAESEADYARQCAEWLNWRFSRIQGDPGLLRDLIFGRWDVSRFQKVMPGQRLIHSPDDQIVRAEF